MGGDARFLLEVLRDGREHELGEILRRSFDERGCGMTVHSRAADLRKLGYKVKNRTVALPGGRRGSYYQLLRVPEFDEAPVSDAAGVSSSPGLRKLGAEDFPLARSGGDAGAAPGPDGDGVSSSSRPGEFVADAPPRWAA